MWNEYGINRRKLPPSGEVKCSLMDFALIYGLTKCFPSKNVSDIVKKADRNTSQHKFK